MRLSSGFWTVCDRKGEIMLLSKNGATGRRIQFTASIFTTALLIVFVLIWQGAAVARETVTEQLLDIMKAKHVISEREYKALKKEAEEEKAALNRQLEKSMEVRKAALARQVREQIEEREKAQAAGMEAQVKAAQAKLESENNPHGFHTVWRNGIVTESNDGNFKMHVGGYGELDFGSMNGDAELRALARGVGAVANGYGAEVRRFRPTITGTLWGNIDFQAQMDFGGGTTRVTNVWARLNDIPFLGNVQIGHQKEPFSLEELTSDEWTSFLERALPNTFAVGNTNGDYNTGVKIYNQELDKRMTWALGGFINQSNNSGSFYGNYANTDLVARLTALPWYEDKGWDIVHIGFSYSYKDRKTSNPTLDYDSKPEFHVTNLYTLETGLIPTTGANTFDPELGLGIGSFSLHAEYFNSMVGYDTRLSSNTVTNLAKTKINNPDFDGYYVQASYFLTGENRPYDLNEGIFTRPIPLCNYNWNTGGWGAWELVARFSNANLTSGGITGGNENDVTAGINWYLNPNLKLQMNYIFAMLSDRTYVVQTGVAKGGAAIYGTKAINDADANIIAMRMLFDF